MSVRTAALWGCIALLAALAYALLAQPAEFVGDDGGIALRYAERLGRGLGVTVRSGTF